MGLFDSVKNAVGEENFEKIENAAQNLNKGNSDGSKTDYVQKAEGYIGDERLNQIKDKVGEANFKKGEDFVRNQLNNQSGSSDSSTEQNQ